MADDARPDWIKATDRLNRCIVCNGKKRRGGGNYRFCSTECLVYYRLTRPPYQPVNTAVRAINIVRAGSFAIDLTGATATQDPEREGVWRVLVPAEPEVEFATVYLAEFDGREVSTFEWETDGFDDFESWRDRWKDHEHGKNSCACAGCIRRRATTPVFE